MCKILNKEFKFLTDKSKKKQWKYTFHCSSCNKLDCKIYRSSTWNCLCTHCAKGGYTTKDFIEKSKEIHGDTFTYEQTNYINKRSKVEITCKVHGIFEQRASDHLGGAGCVKCSNDSRKAGSNFVQPNKRVYNKLNLAVYTPYINEKFIGRDAKLYWVYFPQISMYKLGFTLSSINRRFSGALRYPVESDFKLIKKWDLKYEDAVKFEFLLHKEFKEFAYSGNEKLIRTGNSELYTLNILDKIEESISGLLQK